MSTIRHYTVEYSAITVNLPALDTNDTLLFSFSFSIVNWFSVSLLGSLRWCLFYNTVSVSLCCFLCFVVYLIFCAVIFLRRHRDRNQLLFQMIFCCESFTKKTHTYSNTLTNIFFNKCLGQLNGWHYNFYMAGKILLMLKPQALTKYSYRQSPYFQLLNQNHNIKKKKSAH